MHYFVPGKNTEEKRPPRPKLLLGGHMFRHFSGAPEAYVAYKVRQL